eukprot:403330722
MRDMDQINSARNRFKLATCTLNDRVYPKNIGILSPTSAATTISINNKNTLTLQGTNQQKQSYHHAQSIKGSMKAVVNLNIYSPIYEKVTDSIEYKLMKQKIDQYQSEAFKHKILSSDQMQEMAHPFQLHFRNTKSVTQSQKVSQRSKRIKIGEGGILNKRHEIKSPRIQVYSSNGLSDGDLNNNFSSLGIQKSNNYQNENQNGPTKSLSQVQGQYERQGDDFFMTSSKMEHYANDLPEVNIYRQLDQYNNKFDTQQNNPISKLQIDPRFKQTFSSLMKSRIQMNSATRTSINYLNMSAQNGEQHTSKLMKRSLLRITNTLDSKEQNKVKAYQQDQQQLDSYDPENRWNIKPKISLKHRKVNQLISKSFRVGSNDQNMTLTRQEYLISEENPQGQRQSIDKTLNLSTINPCQQQVTQNANDKKKRSVNYGMRRKSQDGVQHEGKKLVKDTELFRETSSKKLIRTLLDSTQYQKPQISKKEPIDEKFLSNLIGLKNQNPLVALLFSKTQNQNKNQHDTEGGLNQTQHNHSGQNSSFNPKSTMFKTSDLYNKNLGPITNQLKEFNASFMPNSKNILNVPLSNKNNPLYSHEMAEKLMLIDKVEKTMHTQFNESMLPKERKSSYLEQISPIRIQYQLDKQEYLQEEGIQVHRNKKQQKSNHRDLKNRSASYHQRRQLTRYNVYSEQQ